jgi:Acyl-CoA dehydrogenase, C-terminal domain
VLPDGMRNALRCDGIEKKMGIKGSATCVMSFEGATGWLVGEPNRGLAAMFAMMNAARLHVALQGLAHAEMAHQNALRYAGERLQSRAVSRPAGVPAAGVDAIALHPAMRRTLLRQRVFVEGSRVIAFESAHLLDLAAHSADADERRAANDHVSLLTPVLKAFLTDNGFALASEALQVFGGHGYVHDWGVEQCVRDSRIAMVYEGTNEIQAIDLVVRKLLPDGGAKFAALLAWLEAALPHGGTHSAGAREALVALGATARDVIAAAAGDAELPHRVAADLLRATGLALLLQAWARIDAVAAAHAAGDAFYAAKRASARHAADYVRPEFTHAIAMVRAGWQPLAFLAPADAA